MRPWLAFLPYLTSLFLVLAFPGVDAGLLTGVALVPLVVYAARCGPWKAFLTGWLVGGLWFYVSLNWITNTLSRYGSVPFPLDQMLILLMGVILGFYTGAFSLLVPLAWRLGPVSGSLALASAWTLLEVVRTWVPAPFPWLYLGSALWDAAFLRPLFPLVGVYGVTFLIVLVNTGVAWSLEQAVRQRYGRGLVFALWPVAVTMFLVLVSTGWHAGNQPPPTVRVAVVQGSFAQEEKWDKQLRETTVDTYLSLSSEAAADGARIILWPETAMPFYFGTEPELEERIRSFVVRRGIHLVFGSPGYDIRGRSIILYNRAYHMAPDGRLAFYDKNRLVPFGEYIPFKSVLSFVEKMVPGEGEFATGRWNGPFRTEPPAGALICFEIAFPDMARREVRGGARLLLNVTNDGWFGRSWGPVQHLVLSSVRAAENGVPVLRAANTGISGIFGERGEVIRILPLYERGVITGDVPLTDRLTFYTRTGDIIVPVAMLMIILNVYKLTALWRSGRWNS